MRAFRRHRRTGRPNLAAALASLAAIAVLTVIIGLFLPGGGQLGGRATAADGDSLRLAGERVRLLDIDAVELSQTCTAEGGREWACGRAARAFLAGLVEDGETACSREGRDRYGRVLARCTVGGRDLGEAVTRAGWSLGGFHYATAQMEARAAGRGIWAGYFVDPEVWRRTGGEPEFDLWAWLLALVGR